MKTLIIALGGFAALGSAVMVKTFSDPYCQEPIQELSVDGTACATGEPFFVFNFQEDAPAGSCFNVYGDEHCTKLHFSVRAPHAGECDGAFGIGGELARSVKYGDPSDCAF